MIFTRKFVVIQMSPLQILAFFNNEEDAVEYRDSESKRKPYFVIKIFEDIT